MPCFSKEEPRELETFNKEVSCLEHKCLLEVF